ncbi:LysR family transcriptional regulator [Paraburkholderia hospita]|uniref:LysR family transcriptional regulator n=1 Tax=Paraburkholderia hospita TaxID=169430 RepID=A0ABN0FFD3_9BURK|nr:LysR family transcriptional regulator [Paraburkholderia hospita]EIM97328.1 LysR family transcriptional regulator [Paraburkholderia hospita]OUL73315.1 LysR family transcriptional regulator [Paraburkholderia hospita]
MEALNLIESFIQSAETGSFSAAARRLGLTPAAVSKNVARLETHLGVRLFHRSTRKLTMTPGGEQLWADAGVPFASLQDAFARAAQHDGKPSGVLKVSMAVAFGREYLVPLLGSFLERYPDIVPDWHFDNRAVDLIAGGFDAAIGGGIELTQGVVARDLARPCVIVAASPAYIAGRPLPAHPSDLAELDGIARRSSSTGRLRAWTMRNQVGEEALAECKTRMIFDDPEAMAHAALAGLGVAFLPTPHAAPWLENGRLMRLLPGWYAEVSPITIYYPNRKLLPAKTRVFIDFIVDAFRERRLAARFDAR